MLGTVWTSVPAYQHILNGLLCGTDFFNGRNGTFPYSHLEGQRFKVSPTAFKDFLIYREVNEWSRSSSMMTS